MKNAALGLLGLTLATANLSPALADGGWGTAGKVLTGVVAGSIVYNALAPRPVIYQPAPAVVYQAPPVVYQPAPQVVVAPPPACYYPAAVVAVPTPTVVIRPVYTYGRFYHGAYGYRRRF